MRINTQFSINLTFLFGFTYILLTMSQTQGKTMEYKRKTIDGYDSYEIDTLGNVYSNRNSRNFKSTMVS